MSKVGSKPKDEMIEPAGVTSMSVAPMPAFLQEVKRDDFGTETLSQYIVPPRLKIVQKQSGKPYSDLFNVGDVVVSPVMSMVAKVQTLANGKPGELGTPFHFIPLFFYAEWALWNPIELKGSQPAVRSRSLDPRSPLAQKAKNPDLWFEKCPELPEKNMRYVEHLNYVIMILNHELSSSPCVMSFSRGSHRSGTNFNSLIRMRNAPLYGCIFEARTSYTANNKGDWYRLDISNPTTDSGMSPWVDDTTRFEALRTLHREYKTHHEQGVLRAEYDDDEVEGAVVTPPSSEF